MASVTPTDDVVTTAHEAPMVLSVTHPVHSDGAIPGFRFLWALYVRGHDATRHCQPGLRGRRVDAFHSRTARCRVPVILDQMHRFPFVYICGVAAGPVRLRGERNLHLPLRYEHGARAEATTYNGFTVTVTNASLVLVPRLPRGWHDLPDAHTQCRTFQFAVAVFGAPDPGHPA